VVYTLEYPIKNKSLDRHLFLMFLYERLKE
jgi:hypothetical protein